MTTYTIEVRVLPRRGILDPQGAAVQTALHSLGHASVEGVHVGRLITLELRAQSEAAARAAAEAMCAQLLANPVTEDFELEVRREGVAA